MKAIKPNMDTTESGRVGAEYNPTPFEVVQIAAQLSNSPENKGKLPVDLIKMAMAYWDAYREAKKHNDEKRILLATIAKVHDDDNLFVTDPMPGSRKSPPAITDQMWFVRFMEYGGNKYELFLDMLKLSIPQEVFLKELFPSPEKSMRDLVADLTKIGGKDWADPVTLLIFNSTMDLPEDERASLMSAFTTGNIHNAYVWLDNSSRNKVCYESLSNLLLFIKSLNRGVFTRRVSVPSLLCREFIRIRELKISQVRAEAAKKRRASK